jgi:DNA-nicking Smr family endonuclease
MQDRKTERRLREGDVALDARLDLHGMTQSQAHAALAGFMKAQAAAGARNLLIITGKGRNNEGVLRTQLTHWLDALPEAALIRDTRQAAARHGGDGAFYVMLKRRRE